MTEDEHNPGKWVMSVGMLTLLVFIVGLAFGAGTPHDKTPVAGLIAAGVILAATIFIASVVGAYYAGKGKR